MTQKPTRLGTPAASSFPSAGVILATPPASSSALPFISSAPAPVVVVGTIDPAKLKIPIPEARLAEAQKLLAQMSLRSMNAQQIIMMGSAEETALGSTLDGFLANLNSGNAAPVFKLFESLSKGVEDAKLPKLALSIQNAQPSLWARIAGRLRGKTPSQIAQESYDSLRGSVSLSTRTLADKVNALQVELNTSLGNLLKGLQTLEDLKTSYRGHFDSFTFAAALAQAFVHKAEGELRDAETAAVGSSDPRVLAELDEMRSKLESAKSRALALDGTYTRLPADGQVIQQIQNAGVATFREALTTASSRTSSIKMTLITVNGALQVKETQNLEASAAQVDAQLQQVRGALVKDVVTTAANAAGNNRLAQANQIAAIVAEAAEINSIVKTARADNETKFGHARTMFANARQQLAATTQS